ncbi:GFA family protein [Vibrio ostreicida]|uniref:GFA family protein n=1 Tax=Vibrio ostreicida TaxID=526588 RepID=A0ABT8C046_9VIBR|nr:GFA family protein [Vibrio ostreicida]MDN3612721.1 GFA family protein [Vibrio ostreicida]
MPLNEMMMRDFMVLGSCNCKAVQFRVTGDFKRIVNCHCKLCRKMNGAAFSTYVAVLKTDFELVRGDLISCDVTENARKHFCGKCGTRYSIQTPNTQV